MMVELKTIICTIDTENIHKYKSDIIPISKDFIIIDAKDDVIFEVEARTLSAEDSNTVVLIGHYFNS